VELTNSIGRQVLFTTVRIQTQLPDGSMTHGTGFIYNANRAGLSIPVLITNKHVVKDAESALVWFIAAEAGKPKLGESVSVSYTEFESQWTGHPNDDVDVTCMLLAQAIINADAAGKAVFYLPIGCEMVPSEDVVAELDVIEDVIFVGYPSALYDTVNLTPIVRRGMTATPIELDYCGLPMFLIDASVFRGSSGSPVFIIQRGGFMQAGQYRVGSTRALFVGIVASTHLQHDEGRIVVSASTPTVEFDQLLDLGLVFNWRAVEETVDILCAKYSVDRDQATLVVDPDRSQLSGD
jgi:hypothetical protein